MINDLRGTPLAGLVIVGDFAENAGLKTEVAVQSAIDAKMPVYTIAIGSNRIPVNVGIADFACRRERTLATSSRSRR